MDNGKYDNNSSVIQFQDDKGRILLSLSVSQDDIMNASLNDIYDIKDYDLSIKKIQDIVAVHSNYKYYYDKIVCFMEYIWWSFREFCMFN